MKKNILRVFFLLMVFALIVSMGANQAKAIQDTPEGNQFDEDETYFSDNDPLDEAEVLESDDSYEITRRDDIPEALQSSHISTITFNADNFIPYDYNHITDYTRAKKGCLGVVQNTTPVKWRQAIFPLAIPAGSQLVGLGFSGVDNLTGSESFLTFSIMRNSYDGNHRQEVAKVATTDAYADPNAFWEVASIDNHIVDADWSYELHISFFPTLPNQLNDMKICQLMVNYLDRKSVV